MAAALAGTAVIGYTLPALAGPLPALRAPLGIEDHTASGEGFALTFDDGPHALGTPAVLEILARSRVRATFFMVGEQVRRDPSLAREVADQGHEIALHCDRHRNLLRLTPWQVGEDIARALDSIETHTGRPPRLYRPPYGILNAAALAFARRHGWRTLLWSHLGKDWEPEASPESIASLATAGAGAGSVLLLHDADDYGTPGSWRRTALALPRILETFAQRGLQPGDP
jgi:peptidoglycan-N-acetylglucosamine deacetylase